MTQISIRKVNLQKFLLTVRIKEEFPEINPDLSYIDMFSGGNEGENFPNIFLCSDADIRQFLDVDTLKPYQTAYSARVAIWSWLAKHHLNDMELINFVINELECDLGDVRSYVKSHLIDNDFSLCDHPKKKKFWLTVCSNWFARDLTLKMSRYDALYRISDVDEIDDSTKVILKNEFVEGYYPLLKIKKVWSFGDDNNEKPDDIRVCQADFEIVADANGLYVLNEIKNRSYGEDLLLDCAEKFSDMLIFAIDKGRSLGIVDVDNDFSTFKKEEIQQNKEYMHSEGLNPLIDAVRDSFSIAWKRDRELAKLLFTKWKRSNVPVFHKLMLFAAVETKHQPFVNACVKLLQNQTEIVMWGFGTRAQLTNKDFGFLTSLKFNPRQLNVLQDLIMAGPPRERYREDIPDERFEQYKEGDIDHRIQRLAKNNYENLCKAVQKRSDLIKDKEFMDPIIGPVEGGFWQPKKVFDGMDVSQVVAKITGDRRDSFQEEEFEQFATENVPVALDVLKRLKDKGFEQFPTYCMRALYGFRNAVESKSEDAKTLKTFEECKTVLNAFDRDIILDLSKDEASYALISFFEAIPKNTDFDLAKDKEQFFEYWDRYFKVEDGKTCRDDPINDAINTSSGRLATILSTILLEVYFSQDVKCGDDLKKQFMDRLERLLKAPDKVAGKVIVASRAFPLFQVDREWVKKNLLPLFNSWEQDAPLCRSMWCGYFWNARYSIEFVEDFKDALQALYSNAQAFDALQERRDYTKLLGQYLFSLYRNYYSKGVFDEGFFVSSLRHLSDDALVDIVWAIGNYMEKCETDDSRVDLWAEVIRPWFQEVFVSFNGDATRSFIRLCCYGKNLFEEMVEFFAGRENFKLSDGYITLNAEYLFEEGKFVENGQHKGCLTILDQVTTSVSFVDSITRGRVQKILDQIKEVNDKGNLNQIQSYRSLKNKIENY